MLYEGDCLGDWVVEGPLGEGGMGTVFLCHSQLSTEVRAAVKVLKSHGLGDFKQRFIDEMRTVASLNHPSIVGVRSGGEDPARGLVYMAMEYIEGGDLEKRLRQGALSMEEVRETFLPLAQALAFAHGRGVHHRDLKPANIMLRDDGPPVLVDFGIAVVQDRTRLTMDGVMPGTAAYMAPEVFRGEDPELALADIYALGVVLWEALCGHDAFHIEGDLSEGQRFFQVVGLKVQSEPLDPGPTVPDALRDLVRHMTEPDPDRRLRDLGEVERVLTGRAHPGAEPIIQRTTWVRNGPYVPVDAPPATAAISAPMPTMPHRTESAAGPAPVQAVPVRRRARAIIAGTAAAGLAAVGLGVTALALTLATLNLAPVEGVQPPAELIEATVEAEIEVEPQSESDVESDILEPQGLIVEPQGLVVQRVERTIPRQARSRSVRRAVVVNPTADVAVASVDPDPVAITPLAAEAPETAPEAEVAAPAEPVDLLAEAEVQAIPAFETAIEVEPSVDVEPDPTSRRRRRSERSSGSYGSGSYSSSGGGYSGYGSGGY